MIQFVPVPVPTTGGDTGSVDAFGRWRVSEPFTLFDSKLIGGADGALFWDAELESGAGITASTPTAAKPYIDFSSTDTTAGVYTRQTFGRWHYQPGKSLFAQQTGVLDLSGGGTGVQRRIGYFDDDNGVFFEDDEGTVKVVIRTSDSGSPVDTKFAQSEWNIDKLDGFGPSKQTIDWTQSQIFTIDVQWLGIGRIRFGVVIDGLLYYVHQYTNANERAIPTMSTPNLPLRQQMITTASSPASSMRCICGVVISEGGIDPPGLTHTHATVDAVNANTADVWYALVGLRLKAAFIGCTVEPEAVSIVSETNDSFEWAIYHNPTVAGTFTFSDKTNSCVQTATGDTANPSTNTVTGGTIIARGFGTSTDASTLALNRSLGLGSAIDGTLDTLVLAVRPLGSNSDLQGSLTWRERL